ncbi:MAG: DUF6781 family protein [Phycisphaerales bacterium JB039]
MDRKLHEEVEEAVKSGEDIRDRVRDAVERAAARADRATGRLTELSRKTMDAALGAIDCSAPDDPESALRQVIDGLGDGLERTAQATRLAVEEAASESRAYASEDLKQTSDDLRTISKMFVETVDRAIGAAGEQTRQQVRGARDHASRTIDSIRPSLESAAEAAARDPIGLVGDSATAAAKLARETTGALFGAVGNLLKDAGDRLKPPSEQR